MQAASTRKAERVTTVAMALALAAAATAARGAEPVAPSPYAGQEERTIKALSADDVAGYLAGAGMGFAMAAELNHHPGPMHVLELAADLGLDDAQRRGVEATERRMRQRAIELGRRLVDAEVALDRAFAEATIDEPGLRRRLHEIADLEADLRHAHLAAHLETRAILSAEQVARYDALRGYTGGAGAPADHDHRGHEGHGGHGGHGG